MSLEIISDHWFELISSISQPTKIDLDKKSLPNQKTIQSFTTDAQGFRKTRNENAARGK